ncbi:uncharacterized protein LOC113357805 [Papaver somniferum]|uniref:uncharacterized protein LOC113357805 n=1 Tax=Papaver somniferum TaxID=3469 RepID=UPI000E6FDC53|nr:uncharacterized protein LOC113357805 [Papaver somniferum]XP_026457051.1 uncharacterized protein LOC113357805 [Papaver somniferum]
MRSKRLELIEAQQKPKKLSTAKRQEALRNLRSSTTKQLSGSVNNSRREKEVVTDAVDEGLDAIAPESSATKSRSAFMNGRRGKENGTDAVGETLNAVALEKKKSLTVKPRVSFVNEPREKEIVTGPLDEGLNAVDDMLDAGGDVRDEDTHTVDSWSDIRDEDASIVDTGSDARDVAADSDQDADEQIADDEWLPTNSDQDGDDDILDADGNADMQFAEDQPLPTNSYEDTGILDTDENGGMLIVDAQSLPTNSENVAGSSRKRKHKMIQRQVTDPHSESNYGNFTGYGQGSTSVPLDRRVPITFDKYGRPCDVGSEEFATDIGKIVRAFCRPAIESWRKVPDSMKENIWINIIARYVVPEIYKPNVLSRASKSYKTWKSQLRVEMDKHETIDEKKMNMPWRLISNREDWVSFVDFCNTDEDKKRRAAGRKARENLEFLHSCGRKGIYRKLYELEKESPTGEVNRAAIFVDTHVSKNINDPESSSISDIKLRLIKELVEANPDGQKDIDNDAVAQVCGLDGKGVVRGMGGGVSRAKVLASAASVETLRKVQQENKSLQSDIDLLRSQLVAHTPDHTSTPSASPIRNCNSVPSNQSASQAPEASNLPARSSVAPPSPNLPARSPLALPVPNLPARSRLAPDVPNLPACSHVAPRSPNLPARSRVAPPSPNLPALLRLALPSSNLPARSSSAPPASNLAASSCFIKNFKGRTIALGSINTADPPMENVHSLIIEEIFDRNAELFDQDGKLGDIMIGGVINWPKACVVSNLPSSSCFIRNFKRRIIAFGNFDTADPLTEDVYSVIVKEIYDRDAELFDEDGKLGDIMIGDVINWPKACVKPCR